MTDHVQRAQIREIARCLTRGHIVLFLGAGVHAGPPEGAESQYPRSKRPLQAHELAARLASALCLSDEYPEERHSDLQRISMFFEQRLGRSTLIREIREATQDGREPSPILLDLARLPFPVIVTTNYDELLEEALRRSDKGGFEKIVYNPTPRLATKEYAREPSQYNPLIFKMHGEASIPESAVITDDDYIHFMLRMSEGHSYHPVPETIKYYIKRWPVLFVGYSLKDFNFRVLFRTLRWQLDPASQPPAFSVDRMPDPLLRISFNRQVTFIVQDIWTFVPALTRVLREADA
jgi:hypothetical protein